MIYLQSFKGCCNYCKGVELEVVLSSLKVDAMVERLEFL